MLLILMEKEMAHRLHAIQVRITTVIKQQLVSQLLGITFKEVNPHHRLLPQFQFLPLLRHQSFIISQCMQFQALMECNIRLSLELLFLKKFLALQIYSRQWEEMARLSPRLDTSNKRLLLQQHHSNHHHNLLQ